MSDGYVVKGGLTGLTPSEKTYLLTHPQHVGTIRENADKALAEAKRLFPGPQLHNGSGDAFRHCYWSALLSRDIGATNARTFTSAHEAFSANPPGERLMDLHNNDIGVRIGRMHPNASDSEMSQHCKAALDTGQLITQPPKGGQPY